MPFFQGLGLFMTLYNSGKTSADVTLLFTWAIQDCKWAVPSDICNSSTGD
ncbi:hypothetical protein C1H46_045538 [Malus baccata]|uniref:Uncharacterized protein n=1 Tax=Malus baccata TaxID=106549 RepID=A0A540K3W6_MALBA|nr:hypothetical protein C1H46_045538 [Malus baccata]